ncbi:MAG: FKBP-type peptidyl-prolyl cis-trans isomerase [Sphingobacteriales bacterium]|nr:MAG: FKBP-type peptidyl-prolyl cis-trans isomerase [Sphingobacteriales bacterium]
MKLLITLGICCSITFQLAAQATKKPATSAKPSAAAKATPKAAMKKVAMPTSALKSSIDSFSYAVGLSLASFYKEQGVENINSALVVRAINDVKAGKQLISEEQVNNCIMEYMQVAKSAKASGNKKEGEAFLAQNKNKQGVVTTASGLQYSIITEGSGPKPTADDQVKVHYHGTLLDGTIFDSSVQRGEPIVLGLRNVIAGWTEALQLMPVGSKWKLYLPSDLAYGDMGSGGVIKPGATLVFEVELIDIVK